MAVAVRIPPEGDPRDIAREGGDPGDVDADPPQADRVRRRGNVQSEEGDVLLPRLHGWRGEGGASNGQGVPGRRDSRGKEEDREGILQGQRVVEVACAAKGVDPNQGVRRRVRQGRVLEQDPTVHAARLLGQDDLELLRVRRRIREDSVPRDDESSGGRRSVRFRVDVPARRVRGVQIVSEGGDEGVHPRIPRIAARGIERDESVRTDVRIVVDDAVEPERELDRDSVGRAVVVVEAEVGAPRHAIDPAVRDAGRGLAVRPRVPVRVRSSGTAVRWRDDREEHRRHEEEQDEECGGRAFMKRRQ